MATPHVLSLPADLALRCRNYRLTSAAMVQRLQLTEFIVFKDVSVLFCILFHRLWCASFLLAFGGLRLSVAFGGVGFWFLEACVGFSWLWLASVGFSWFHSLILILGIYCFKRPRCGKERRKEAVVS